MRMTLFGGSHQYAGIEEHLHAFNTDSTRSSRTSWITGSQFAPWLRHAPMNPQPVDLG